MFTHGRRHDCCRQFRVPRCPVWAVFDGGHEVTVSLVGEQLPNAATAGTPEQPQFPVARLATDELELQHQSRTVHSIHCCSVTSVPSDPCSSSSVTWPDKKNQP